MKEGKTGAFDPSVLDLLDQLRQVALEFRDSEEYSPWGNRAFFRELKGRNFLFANEKKDHLEVVFRPPPGQKEKALVLPFVEDTGFMGYRGWLVAKITTPEELDRLKPWIELSYTINQPFRTAKDFLPGEVPGLLEMLEEVRQLALTFGNGDRDIEEYFPFGDRAFRRRKGKIFLYAGENGDSLTFSVRLPSSEREYAISLPFVEVPKYIGHKGWVAVKVGSREEMEFLLPWLQMSFDLNQPARKMKKKS